MKNKTRRKKPQTAEMEQSRYVCVWLPCVLVSHMILAEVNENKWEFKCKQRPSSVVAVKRVEFAKRYANPMRSNNQIKRSCINIYICSHCFSSRFFPSSILVPCIFVCVFPNFSSPGPICMCSLYLSTFFVSLALCRLVCRLMCSSFWFFWYWFSRFVAFIRSRRFFGWNSTTNKTRQNKNWIQSYVYFAPSKRNERRHYIRSFP